MKNTRQKNPMIFNTLRKRLKQVLSVVPITLSLLLFTALVQAEYSKNYDQILADLILTQPQKALQISQEKLHKAQISQDIEQQLIALYYKASAQDVLSQQQDLEDTINQGLALAKKHQKQRFITEFLGFLAIRLELKGQFLPAVNTANQALQLAHETGDDRLIAEQLIIRGQTQLAIENYDLALQDVNSAISVFKDNDDKDNLSISYNLLAIIYTGLEDYDNAIKYYQESEAYDLMQSAYNQAILSYNLGSVFFDKKDYPQAISYFEKSQQLSKQNNDTYSLAFTQYGLAQIYLVQLEYDKAQAELTQVFEIFTQNHDILMLFNGYLLMAEINTAKNLYDDAARYIELAEEYSKTLNTPIVQLNLLYQKIAYHVAKQEWQQAYELNKQHKELTEQLMKKDKEKLISELRIKYNAQFDQEKMELLQAQNQWQQTAIIQEKTTKKYLWGLILLGLILLLLTYLGYCKQRNMKRHLFKLSITDYLTNVSNRRHIIEQLKQLHLRSITEKHSFTVVMADLDFFKSINDNYGHDTGNEVLIHFANTAKNVLADMGQVGRVGGEEWLFLIDTVDTEKVKQLLQQLRLAYRQTLSIKIPDACILNFSSGALLCTGQYENFEKILSTADKALYQAKQKGRNQDVFV